MKHLKIVQKGWEGYSSVIGGIKFVDGVSEYPVPRNIADRISGGIQMVEINEDGSETPAGVAHRLVAEAKSRMPVVEPMARQSDADKEAETALASARADKVPGGAFYTGEELMKLASSGGIRGLRGVADKWGVKHREIPKLIELVLAAQGEFLKKRNMKMQARSQKQLDAIAEEQATKEAAAAKLKEQMEEADRIASTLLGSSILASSYKAGDKVIQLGEIVNAAHLRTSMTVNGWNALNDEKREALLAEELKRFEDAYGPLVDANAPAPTEGDESKEDVADAVKKILAVDTPEQVAAAEVVDVIDPSEISTGIIAGTVTASHLSAEAVNLSEIDPATITTERLAVESKQDEAK